jgi:ATP-binding protein involved in chromosome partitioning
LSSHSHAAPQTGPQPLPGIQNIIAIGSGKGGVGKTTVAVNLAVALSKLGHRVGLLDGDIYGPNVPLMMGALDAQPKALEGNRIQPIEQYGIKMISVGLLNPGDKPVIWRGPMLHSIIRQFLQQVEWGELDYLIIDLPPGTGDVAISLIQSGYLWSSREHEPLHLSALQARDRHLLQGRWQPYRQAIRPSAARSDRTRP